MEWKHWVVPNRQLYKPRLVLFFLKFSSIWRIKFAHIFPIVGNKSTLISCKQTLTTLHNIEKRFCMNGANYTTFLLSDLRLILEDGLHSRAVYISDFTIFLFGSVGGAVSFVRVGRFWRNYTIPNDVGDRCFPLWPLKWNDIDTSKAFDRGWRSHSHT